MDAIVYQNNIKILICWQSKLQSGEPMDQWIDGSIGSMYGWFGGLMDGWIDRSIHLSMYLSLYWLMDR